MRVAVTARGMDPEEEIDQRFGRAYWILINDEKKNTWEALDNAIYRNSRESAGVKCARRLVERDVKILLTGEIGPKALRILREGGIRVFIGGEGSIEEVIEAWRRDLLKEAAGANCTGSPDCLVGKFRLRAEESLGYPRLEKTY